jgi:hypothetical protein
MRKTFQNYMQVTEYNVVKKNTDDEHQNKKQKAVVGESAKMNTPLQCKKIYIYSRRSNKI